jgi:hypothetical protein
MRVVASAGLSEWLAPAVAWALVLAAFDAFMFAREGRGASFADITTIAGIDALGVVAMALAFDAGQHVRTRLALTGRRLAEVGGVALLALVAWTTAAKLVDSTPTIAVAAGATATKVAIALTVVLAASSLRARIATRLTLDLLARAVLLAAIFWLQTRFRWTLRESRHALTSAVLLVISTAAGLRFFERAQQSAVRFRPSNALYLPAVAIAFAAVRFGEPSVEPRAYLRGLVAGRMLYAAHLPAAWRLKKPYAAIRRFAEPPKVAGAARALTVAGVAPSTAAADARPEVALVITIDALRYDAFESAVRADDSPLRRYVAESCFSGAAYSPSSDTASTFRAWMEARDGEAANWLERFSAHGIRTTLIMNRFVVDHLAARMTPPLDAHFDEVVAPPRKLPSDREADDINRLTLTAARAPVPRHLVWAHHFDVHEWHGERPARSRDDGYRARVHATLSSIARLLDTLNTGERRLTVFLLSDHGEGLGHFSTETHGEYLYEPLVRVPYLLWTSDRGCDFASLGNTATGTLSTAVTPRLLARRFGVTGALAPARGDDTIFMAAGFQTGVIAWPHKLIVSPWFEELYDLSQDPSETVNLATSSPEIVQRLTRAISREGLIDP